MPSMARWTFLGVCFVPLIAGCSSSDPSSESPSGSTCPGKCAPEYVLEFAEHVSVMTLDDQRVYFANGGTMAGCVYYAPIGGGEIKTVDCKQPYLQDMLVDGNALYWITNGANGIAEGTVMKLDVATGAMETLATDQYSASGLALNAGSIYWSTWSKGPTPTGRVMHMPLGGGLPELLLEDARPTRDLATDGNTLYYTTFDDPSAVRSIPVAGGTPITLVDGLKYARPPVFDAASVYTGDSTGKLVKAPRLGGATQVIADVGSPIGRLVVDGDRIYFTVIKSARLYMVGTDGSNLTQLSEGEPEQEAWDIAVDATHIYWTISERGIGRSTKP